MRDALANHWPEYLIEAATLGLFMVSACFFGTLLEYPGSPVRQAIDGAFARRVLMGAAMGLTAIAIVYSPWGQRSGAHMNPAFTLTFFALGKISWPDALYYMTAQTAGGLGGVVLSRVVLGQVLADPKVNYVVTVPGPQGVAAALVAEVVIAFLMMLTVLAATNTPRVARYTGYFVGFLLLLYISFEAPISGMSLNPARTFGSAAPAGVWTAFWIYLIGPAAGMFAAATVFRSRRVVYCAKLHHANNYRCIFRCGYMNMETKEECRQATTTT